MKNKIIDFLEIDKNKLITAIFLFVFLLILSIVLAPTVVYFLERNFTKFDFFTILSMYKKTITFQLLLIFTVFDILISCIVLIKYKWYKSKEIKITEDIKIPVSSGQNQYGSSKFMDKKNYDKEFDYIILDINALDEDVVNYGENVYKFIVNNKEFIDKLIDEED